MTESIGEFFHADEKLENGYMESGFLTIEGIPSYKFSDSDRKKEDVSMIASELVCRN